MNWKFAKTVGATVLALSGSAPVLAQDSDVKLPDTISAITYDVGSTAYNQIVALGATLKNAYGISVRVLPATSDVARLLPVGTHRIDFGVVGSEALNAVEGSEAFSAPEIGPQRLRKLAGANSKNCFTMGLRGDAGIENASDLRGKRVAWVVGAPALQSNATAYLAFAGLTWDDVEKVDVASYNAQYDAMLNNQLDAAVAVTTGGKVEQVAASPGGLAWMKLPPEDKEGWARLRAQKPQFTPRVGTVGANLTEDNPLDCAGFPYPMMVTYPERDADVVYNLTKAIVEQYDNYVEIEPAMAGWAGTSQIFQYVIPYHDGAIRLWKEQGLWTEEDQAHNDALISRQDLLISTWEKLGNLSGEEKTKRWLEERAAVLTAAGLPTY